MMAAPSTGPIREPQGVHYPWYSMSPLTDVGDFLKNQGEYFKKCKAASGGAAIYKIHPGLKVIALTDTASSKWFFAQPDSVLDRQDGSKFGPLVCSKEYIGESLPALVTNIKESHSEVRAFMIESLMETVGASEGALLHASDKFYSDIKTTGLGEYPVVYEFFLQLTYAIMLEWVLGTGEEGGQPLPPFKDFLLVNPADVNLLIKLEIDTPIANFAIQALQMKKGGPSAEQKVAVQVVSDSITSSKRWPRFMEVLEKNNVPITQLERSFMFTTGFQTSSPMAKNMECVIAALNADPAFWKDLQDELDGQDLTMAAVADVSRFPLLDSLHWEILRHFARPAFFCKEAKMDLVIPTSNGDQYQVRKGDMLMCHQVLAQMDEISFGADAKEFNCRRFVGKPHLKKEMCAFGYPDSNDVSPKEGMPWGCVGHAIGVIDPLLKALYGRWVQEYTWESNEQTILDPDAYLGYAGPTGMRFKSITPRK